MLQALVIPWIIGYLWKGFPRGKTKNTPPRQKKNLKHHPFVIENLWFFFFLNIGPKGAKHGTGCETKAQAVPARMALGSPAGPMGTSHLGCGPCLAGPPTGFFFFFAIGALLANKKPKASVHRWKKILKKWKNRGKASEFVAAIAHAKKIILVAM